MLTAKTWLLAALLAFATLVVYAPVLRNGFVEFDDPAYVTSNAHVQQGLTLHNVAWAFTSFNEANWHPLTWLSHMADVQLFSLAPAGHHATSILIHALNAAFLFLLLQRGTGYTWRSLVVAALFALHPMNVENVAWVAERKSLLCMFFSLATVAFYARYVLAQHWTRYLAVVAAFAMALMSKPMAVTLPVLLLFLDYWPLRRVNFDNREGIQPLAQRSPAPAIFRATLKCHRRDCDIHPTHHLAQRSLLLLPASRSQSANRQTYCRDPRARRDYGSRLSLS